MENNHPSTGADVSAAMWRAQRIRQVDAPDRINDHIALALDAMSHMDDCDSDMKNLALVLIHCTRALVTAMDNRA